MTMAYPMETPSRVLRRVQQMEDVELPSLPSIEHGLDDDTGSEAETSLEASLRSRKGQDEMVRLQLEILMEIDFDTGHGDPASPSSDIQTQVIRVVHGEHHSYRSFVHWLTLPTECRHCGITIHSERADHIHADDSANPCVPLESCGSSRSRRGDGTD